MSKRLQVLLDERDLAELSETAKAHGLTTSEWVRRALREASRGEAGGDLATKLASLRRAASHQFPTADIDQMLAEIDRGYLSTKPE